MTVKIKSGTYNNLQGVIIDVEVDISKGMPCFNIVGLPDASVKEARERVRLAISNSGYKFPLGKITISLAPADLKKEGSLLDLPIALGILMETNQISQRNIKDFVVFGELSLSGHINSVRGTLPILLKGQEEGIENYIFPYSNINECVGVHKLELYPYKTLKEVISFINFNDSLPWNNDEEILQENIEFNNFESIIGQDSSKRAILVGACGNHNMFLYGTTGCGKTMLAKALPSILPSLDIEEEIQVSKIYSITGNFPKGKRVSRPFRNPHHTITVNALVGGGGKIKIGEITLAHKGVLFLDEILEFKREVLEVLRGPLEEGNINISRINGSYRAPSEFLMISTSNICPCGKGDLVDIFYKNGCSCTENEKRKYLDRLSKAIRDRIDIFNYVPKLQFAEINKYEDNYKSNDMKEIVLRVRNTQINRLKGTKYKYNSEIRGKDIFEICNVRSKIKDILESYFNMSNPSLRAYGKVIKLSRTIADIGDRKDISEGDVLEALTYRKDSYGNII